MEQWIVMGVSIVAFILATIAVKKDPMFKDEEDNKGCISIVATYNTTEEIIRKDSSYYQPNQVSVTSEKKEVTKVLIINKHGDLEVKTYDGKWTLTELRKGEED